MGVLPPQAAPSAPAMAGAVEIPKTAGASTGPADRASTVLEVSIADPDDEDNESVCSGSEASASEPPPPVGALLEMSMAEVLAEANAPEGASAARDEGMTSTGVEPPSEAVVANDQPVEAEGGDDDTTGVSVAKDEASTAVAEEAVAEAAPMADAVPIEKIVKHVVEVVFPDPLSVNLGEAFQKMGKRKARAEKQPEEPQATREPQSSWREDDWPAAPAAEAEVSDTWQPGQPWPDEPAGEEPAGEWQA